MNVEIGISTAILYPTIRRLKNPGDPSEQQAMRMFAKKHQKRCDYQAAEIQERFERNERTGKDIYARIGELKNVARDNLVHEVFMLFREAKHQSQLIRQSIKDCTQRDFDIGGMSEGDLATFRAEEAACALRDHVTNPQTFFQAMSEQLPDVHFTIQQQDAVSMVAAMIREQRLEGILEGLRLAGVLNAPGKRSSSPKTDEHKPG